MNAIIDQACKAAFDGNIVELNTCINQKIDINESGTNWTILHSAIENEHLACVRLIIQKGADLEFKGNCGMTPLAHAIDIAIDSNNNTGGNIGDESTENN